MIERHFCSREPGPDQRAFIAAIADEPYNQLRRDIYSDWLEENGEQAEADRQRQWTASSAWLRTFSDLLTPDYDEMMDAIIAYQLTFRKWGGDYTRDDTESYKDVEFDDEFWKHFEIVSGMRVLEDRRDCPFTCSC